MSTPTPTKAQRIAAEILVIVLMSCVAAILIIGTIRITAELVGW